MSNELDNDHPRSWEALLAAEQLIQQAFPQAILVGGTAAALHVHHRVSFDGDHVLPDLRSNYENILHDLEAMSGWNTARLRPPVLILGNLSGIETGLRQLKRNKPLETTQIQGLCVPTLAEMLRIKAYLCCVRNTTRDYLDTAALWHFASEVDRKGLLLLDDLYPQAPGAQGISAQLCAQLANPNPGDRSDVTLSDYKGLSAPWSNWDHIVAMCRELATQLGHWKGL